MKILRTKDGGAVTGVEGEVDRKRNARTNQVYIFILPVMLSHNIRDVMMRPYGLNNDSRSG